MKMTSELRLWERVMDRRDEGSLAALSWAVGSAFTRQEGIATRPSAARNDK
ncbi:MAG: hypothetical protein ACOC5U_03455 [Candidatus Aminicenantaceae bacterium]